jgi:hypothetical protein
LHPLPGPPYNGPDGVAGPDERTHPSYAENAAKQSFDEAKRFLSTLLPVAG